MPNTYTIPTGGLNQVPAVTGIEDVTISVPTVDDIATAVRSNTLDRTQIDEAIVAEVGGAVNGWWTEFEIATQIIDGVAAEVVDIIESSFGIDVPGEGSLIDEVVAETPATEDIDQQIEESIERQLGEFDPNNISVNFEGIFGPLSEDVAQGLEEIIGFDPDAFVDDIVERIEQSLGIDIPGDGPLLSDIPTLSDIQEALAEELDGLSPDINGVEFWRNPLRFADEAWDQRKELVLSESSRQNLIDALDEIGAWDG